ncbi:energy-coupling factor transporter ATP-binding protein EcfA1 [bacterium BMS3Abin05]|nr:energy-coupling factor transporter ATP-binding protein EcfA1 [bacterium BMS3Abin05]GBE27035.1 energy-coupling factor transporter ATP-binding protein EcfA1 [bacterium BMS3Bbin03]
MIDVEDLTFSYTRETSPILKNFSLKLVEDKSVSIMGANGSGKTTLSRCLNGLLLPESGTVRVDGLDTRQKDENLKIRALVGMVFQNPDNQIVSTTVEREVAFGLENLEVPYEEMHRRVEAILRQFGLEKYRHKSPHYLSGGEKQLLALASIFVMSPKYIILDEPTSLLDPASREKILDAVFELREKSGIIPILITQFPEETLRTDRLILLHKGKIVFDEKPADVFEHEKELREIGIGVPLYFSLKPQLEKLHLWGVV